MFPSTSYGLRLEGPTSIHYSVKRKGSYSIPIDSLIAEDPYLAFLKVVRLVESDLLLCISAVT